MEHARAEYHGHQEHDTNPWVEDPGDSHVETSLARSTCCGQHDAQEVEFINLHYYEPGSPHLRISAINKKKAFHDTLLLTKGMKAPMPLTMACKPT